MRIEYELKRNYPMRPINQILLRFHQIHMIQVTPLLLVCWPHENLNE